MQDIVYNIKRISEILESVKHRKDKRYTFSGTVQIGWFSNATIEMLRSLGFKVIVSEISTQPSSPDSMEPIIIIGW